MMKTMDQDPADEPTPRPRSSFEDFDIPDPEAVRRAAGTTGRSPTVTTAAGVLLANGLLGIGTALLFKPEGAIGPALLVLGAAQLVASGLVFMLHPVGRWLGIVLGVLGLVVGAMAATSSAANGLVSLALDGFVIYALASSGPSFRRG
jgi:hypothetical protein